jgi:hypothetical protein
MVNCAPATPHGSAPPGLGAVGVATAVQLGMYTDRFRASSEPLFEIVTLAVAAVPGYISVAEVNSASQFVLTLPGLDGPLYEKQSDPRLTLLLNVNVPDEIVLPMFGSPR